MADQPPPPHTETQADGKPVAHIAVRTGWLILGLFMVALGIIGAFLPLMPTTIFLILAAGCFTHSSPRLESWLLDHPRHGPALRAWRAEGAITRRGKQAACIGMIIGFTLFYLISRPTPLLAGGVLIALMGCAWWIITRPLPSSIRQNDGIKDSHKTATDCE